MDFQKIRDRALYIRRWLKARPEKEIVVVSHGGFLHFLTDDWEDGSTGWANTECRTYEFLPDGNDSELEDAMIQETVESRQCRGKFGPPPTRASQKELCGLILQGWADQGYAIREGNSVEDEIKLR
ncbi:uncharacterized protein N7496_012199 [Penicillium cataractarum]|uniref:Uncharacterized protein n=1 Tax=Penicillium cataractarum TaxID=2100454 RepID=A0A9W9URT3_9EURO|nr:uncharacterized protein N7496_012199 [Penicillium cataractarum]KAJ5354987.1 hypothetical protein N7496_012199 [Penicillium cataractarum]